METKHVTILFVDMKGFTSLTATLSRKQVSHLLDTFEKLIKPKVKEFKGEIIKALGDGYIITFASPTNAVLCAMKIQEALSTHNAVSPATEFFELRIALNTGEVTLKNGDIFGEPVNLASRVEMVAKPGEVYLTEAVYLAMNKNEVPVEKVGRGKLKGIPGNVKVYRVAKEQSEIIKSRILRGREVLASYFLPKDKLTQVKKPKKIKSFSRRHFQYLTLVVLAFLIVGTAVSSEEKKEPGEKFFITEPVTKEKQPPEEVQAATTALPTSTLIPNPDSSPTPTPKGRGRNK